MLESAGDGYGPVAWSRMRVSCAVEIWSLYGED